MIKFVIIVVGCSSCEQVSESHNLLAVVNSVFSRHDAMGVMLMEKPVDSGLVCIQKDKKKKYLLVPITSRKIDIDTARERGVEAASIDELIPLIVKFPRGSRIVLQRADSFIDKQGMILPLSKEDISQLKKLIGDKASHVMLLE